MAYFPTISAIKLLVIFRQVNELTDLNSKRIAGYFPTGLKTKLVTQQSFQFELEEDPDTQLITEVRRWVLFRVTICLKYKLFF